MEDVRRHPGSSARDIQRRLGLGWGDTAYQLDRLLVSGGLRRERGGWRDYYFSAELTWADRRIWQALRSRAERTLVLTVMTHPDSTFTQLVARTGFARSTASFHLRRLQELRVIANVGGESGPTRFRVIDSDRVHALLSVHRASLSDELVDRFVDAFGGLVSA